MEERYNQCVDYFNSLILKELDLDCWVAGGALRDFFTIGYPLHDIDIFFPNITNFNLAKKWFENSKAIKKYESPNSIRFLYKRKVYDIIRKYYYPTPQETINKFDFTICCCAVSKEQVWHKDTFFCDLARRKLIINNITFPLSTLNRLQKYIKNGYSICNGGLLEISKAIQKVNLSNPEENTFEYYSDGKVKFITFD